MRTATSRHYLFIICLCCSTWLLVQGSYIHTKAVLAQILLHQAWNKTLQSNEIAVKPWPWADTWPVAKLSVPALKQSQIVLAGVSGEALAFGPGHLPQSAKPGSHDITIENTVIAGHRDTHFHFVKALQKEDIVELQSPSGEIHHYRITEQMVVHESETNLLTVPTAALILITCYPFDTLQSNGPLRYLVFAEHITSPVVI